MTCMALEFLMKKTSPGGMIYQESPNLEENSWIHLSVSCDTVGHLGGF